MNTHSFCFSARLLLQFAIIFETSSGLYISLYGAFGSFQYWQLLYYTNLSNLAVLVLFTVLSAKNLYFICQQKKSQHTVQPRAFLFKIQIALTWVICITGIVWHTLLVPFIQSHPEFKAAMESALAKPSDMAAMLYSMQLLHTWSPFLAFSNWLLFCPKGQITRLTPLTWLLIPTSYFIFICIWVYTVGPVNQQLHIIYPYPFIDFANNPVSVIWLNIAFIAMGMLVLAYLFWGLDCLMKRWRFHISPQQVQ